MRIVVDDRERRSGIIEILEETGATVTTKRLLYGDYLIDGQLVVERKTAFDFVESIKSGRLFRQVRELKKVSLRVVLMIEGDPYRTASTIKPKAVRNAMLSLSAVWQMPTIFSLSVKDSVALFQVLSKHLKNSQTVVSQRCALRPKRLVNRQLETDNEVECAPSTDLAFCPDTPTHYTDQTGGDSKPEARSSVLSSRGRVRLRKRIKDHRQLVCRDSNA